MKALLFTLASYAPLLAMALLIKSVVVAVSLVFLIGPYATGVFAGWFAALGYLWLRSRLNAWATRRGWL